MADVNRGDRPLSPHLMIYRPLYTMILSITHRITGAGLSLGVVLVTWWFLALSISERYFEIADAALNSVIGAMVLIASLWALMFHLCNGVRHLFWDAGYGFDLKTSWRTGLVVIGGSIILTALVLAVSAGVR